MDSLTPLLDSLAEYPRWFVAACLTVVAAVVIWLLLKVLKVALYVLLAGVIIGGIGAVAWLLWH
ncbi:MAG: hypothetical protein KA257_09615 [Opitutaceae bacterium]|nr:hypothetical protein [Opitutaceae bacterium]